MYLAGMVGYLLRIKEEQTYHNESSQCHIFILNLSHIFQVTSRATGFHSFEMLHGQFPSSDAVSSFNYTSINNSSPLKAVGVVLGVNTLH